MTLQELGYDEWFRTRPDDSGLADVHPARIIAVDRNRYVIHGERGEMPAEITGKMLYSADSGLDLPAAGDWVRVQYLDADTFAVIHRIIPRKNVLKRKSPGKDIDYQVIAANIDTAFIMQSLDFNFNPRRLERYLAMVTDEGITPVILLSKSDVVSQELLEESVAEIRSIDSHHAVVSFSNTTGDGLDRIVGLITPGRTHCLLGSSGVGKTSLINRLTGSDELYTMPVREKDSRGRHATTRRELFVLENGGLLIDTPGMRELGNFGIEEGLRETFSEIRELAAQCRFSDCTHLNEPGCAVLAALEDDTLPVERYDNYMKMKRESDFYERSRLERRRRDREFGRMVKRIKKESKKR